MNLDELKNLIKEGIFHSPTKGVLNLSQVINELINYKKEDPQAEYRIVIGTDSETRENGLDLVCVLAVHKVGFGGRYFWSRINDKRKLDLRSKIHLEATVSLALAGALLEKELELRQIKVDMGQSIAEIFKSLEEDSKNSLNKEIVFSNDLEIHVDIGSKGPTRDMIKEITGMIRGSGFYVKIKPEAYAAANVADRYL
jgi:hypothetical protein